MLQANPFSLPVLPFILLIALLLPACTLFNDNDDQITDPDFTANYQKWQSTRSSSYTIVIDQICYCLRKNYPAKVVVQADTISTVLNPDTNEPVPEDSLGSPELTYADVYPTIDGLFELLKEAMKQNADRIDVAYNEDLGFPQDIDIDYDKNVADEEMGYEIKSFSDYVQENHTSF